MTGTIHQLAQQAKTDEMLRQAAGARRARMTAEPKDRRSQSARILIATLLAVVAMCVAAAAASAETVHVDLGQQDAVSDDGACSLREAINLTNGGPASSHPGCDTTAEPAGSKVISLDAAAANGPARYPIASLDYDDRNATGDFDILADVTIVGRGPAASWIDGGHLDRVLDIARDVTVSVTGVTILNGKTPQGWAGNGGAIQSWGTLTLTDCVVRDSAAGTGANGAPYTDGDDGGEGGGIWSAGPLTLVDSTVTRNRAGNGGKGGDGVDVPGYGGAGGSAGGVAAYGGLVVRNSTISDNAAGAGGTGGTGSLAGNGGAGGRGGGLLVLEAGFTIENSIITGNTAGGAGLGGEAGTGNAGAGGAGGVGGGLAVATSGNGTVNASSIAGNAAGKGGAGGHAAVGAQGQGSDGGSGGGLYVFRGTIAVTGSTIADNASGNGGQGAPGARSGKGGEGGGVATTGGLLRIATSTLSGNRAGAGAASTAEPVARGGHGGAVYAAGVGLEVVNSTVSGNAAGQGGDAPASGFQAGTGGSGGGIYAGVGDVTVTTSTVASNAVGQGGTGAQPGSAGLGGAITGTYSLRQSLLVANGPSGCVGTGTDGGHNLEFASAGCPGIHADPKLAPLASNGGPTLTQALGAGSAARDQVPASGAGCPATDQRGGSRPKGGACDIGAFEADPVADPVPGGGATPAEVVDTIAPVVTRYAVASHKIRRGRRGTRVSLTVSEPGTATFTVKRVARGKRLATVASFSRRSLTGVNRFTFTGRVKGKALKPGGYKLVLVVKDVAGNASRPKAVGFKVVK